MASLQRRSVLAVLPGSRRGEVSRLLPIFGETVALLAKRGGPFVTVIPDESARRGRHCACGDAALAEPAAYFVDATDDFRCSSLRAAGNRGTSGTVSLELAMAGVPHIIAYRVNPLSALAFRLLRRTRYVNLVNVLLDRVAVPELLQGRLPSGQAYRGDRAPARRHCRLRERQQDDFRMAAAKLSPAGESPSLLAARTVLAMIGR